MSPESQDRLRTARLLSLALGVAAPLTYLLITVVAGLGGNPKRLLAGFSGLSWSGPLLPVLLVLSAAMVGLSAVLPGRLAARQPGDRFARLQMALIIRAALLEAVAVFGLVLVFLLGPPAATLSLLLILVPLVGTVFTFPASADWE